MLLGHQQQTQGCKSSEASLPLLTEGLVDASEHALYERSQVGLNRIPMNHAPPGYDYAKCRYRSPTNDRHASTVQIFCQPKIGPL